MADRTAPNPYWCSKKNKNKNTTLLNVTAWSCLSRMQLFKQYIIYLLFLYQSHRSFHKTQTTLSCPWQLFLLFNTFSFNVQSPILFENVTYYYFNTCHCICETLLADLTCCPVWVILNIPLELGACSKLAHQCGYALRAKVCFLLS